jgi:DNA gyrase subunit A
MLSLNNFRSAIIITNNGYIKRIPLSLFESQARGGRGKFCGKLSKDEETVAHFITCRDHDSLVFITEK